MAISTVNRIKAVIKNDRMAKKRKGGKHKTPRRSVGIPITWIDVARKLAVKRRQPMMWYIVSKIAEDAEKDGIQLPDYPWDEEYDVNPEK